MLSDQKESVELKVNACVAEMNNLFLHQSQVKYKSSQIHSWRDSSVYFLLFPTVTIVLNPLFRVNDISSSDLTLRRKEYGQISTSTFYKKALMEDTNDHTHLYGGNSRCS